MTEREKRDILEKAEIMSDFLKIEFLEKKLKEVETFDVKKFIHELLSEIYDEKKMHSDAGKHFENAAEIAITRKEKKDLYEKSLKQFIKAGDLEKLKLIINKISDYIDDNEKKEVLDLRKSLLKEEAERFELNGRNNNALRIYEHLFKISSDSEKIELKEKLIFLYEKLGKIREARALKGI